MLFLLPIKFLLFIVLCSVLSPVVVSSNFTIKTHLSAFAQFEYPALSVVQLRFLRLQSNRAEQRVTYSCYPGHQLGQTQRQVQFLTDSVKQSYLGELQDCVVCGF